MRMSTHTYQISDQTHSKFRDQQVLVLRTKSSLDIFITLDTCRRVKPREIRHHTCLLSMIIHIAKLLALLKCSYQF